jgi:hypothetical protein
LPLKQINTEKKINLLLCFNSISFLPKTKQFLAMADYSSLRFTIKNQLFLSGK